MATRLPQRSHAIVVGTDLLPGSQLAAARAAELARRHRATLHVVHAASRLPVSVALRFRSLGELREALHSEVEELRDAGTDAIAHLMHGEAAPKAEHWVDHAIQRRALSHPRG